MAQERLSAEQVMNDKLFFIDGMATVKEAIEIMNREHVNAILVEKRSENDAWAIISVKDIIRGPVREARRFEDVNVYEIMTKPVLAVPADMDISYAARLLDRLGVNRAPVEKKGELIGMITLSAIVKRLAE